MNFEPAKKRVRTIWHIIGHYTYGMFATSFNSSITAIDAVIGLSVGAATSDSVTKPNWQAALAVFGTSFVRSCFLYFKSHPLPEKLPDGSLPPFSESSDENKP